MPVTIDRRPWNHVVFVPLILLWLGISGFVLVLFAGDAVATAAPVDWVKLVLAGVFVLGVVGFLLSYYACRIAFRAEVGDEFRSRTLLGWHRVPWGDVGRFVLKELAIPIPAACVLKVVLTDGTRIDVWSNLRQAEEAYKVACTRPLARDWPGLPLWPATAWAALGLGGAVLLAGLWVAGLAWGEVFGAGAARLDPDEQMKLLAVAMVSPLVGLAGVVFGGYHLIRRPLVVRGGVERFREGGARTEGEAVKELFTRHE
jgi:hypothetical protein